VIAVYMNYHNQELIGESVKNADSSLPGCL